MPWWRELCGAGGGESLVVLKSRPLSAANEEGPCRYDKLKPEISRESTRMNTMKMGCVGFAVFVCREAIAVIESLTRNTPQMRGFRKKAQKNISRR
jgi:hypothetical protein